MHVGIDVGGTNTVAVLAEGIRILAWGKVPTSEDTDVVVAAALHRVLREGGRAPDQVRGVSIGTTHFTNAVLQASGLARTAAIRLSLPAARGVPPLTGWPAPLAAALGNHAYLCHGGHELDGRVISPLDPDELRRVADDLARHDIGSVAITSIFSPLTADVELAAADVLRAELPHLRVSLSHELGRIGLLERENAAILDAALFPVAERFTAACEGALTASGVTAPLHLCRHDGTLADPEEVRRHPVTALGVGPTNSLRGAGLLSGLDDCVVVDIGGTSTDLGVLVDGHPRPAAADVVVAGIRTNLRMPDVVSVPLGGGSVITPDPLAVGPASVGRDLTRRALVFGGSTLTATDVAVALGQAELGDRSLARGLPRDLARAVRELIVGRVAELAASLQTARTPLPMVLVGGGAILLPDAVPGFAEVVRPEHFEVANAVGASLTQVSGEVDRLYVGAEARRRTSLDAARDEAIAGAVAAGADPATVRVVEMEELPIAYLPGDAVRVRVRAVGDLLLAERV